MLTHLRIQNFKAWQDTKGIPLAPLTMFFGSNSSGKSSLSQFLLMLKQTAQSPDRKRVIHPGDIRTPVDLGTTADLMFGRNQDLELGFELGWRQIEPIKFSDPKSSSTYESDELSFKARIGRATSTSEKLIVKEFQYGLGDLPKGGLKVGMELLATGGKYELTHQGYDPVRHQGRVWKLPHPTRFYGFPNEVSAYFQNSIFASELPLALERQLELLHYLGPLRVHPQPSYIWSGEAPENVGWKGEQAIPALLAARERSFNFVPKEKLRGLDEVLAFWLKEMGLIESFEARLIAKHRKEYEVLVRTQGSQHTVNLTHVGFGVSQILPVLISCFYAPRGATIILEQPEIHLHPAVQAALADFFIAALRARENSEGRQIQLIVESHSEHLLRRVQRRIAEGSFSADDTALYFCRSASSGATIEPLKVDVFGNITNWPKDFFGDEMGEIAAMAKAQLDRAEKEDSSK